MALELGVGCGWHQGTSFGHTFILGMELVDHVSLLLQVDLEVPPSLAGPIGGLLSLDLLLLP
jgi:hypothetical protein